MNICTVRRREWLMVASQVVEKYGEVFKLEYDLPCPIKNITEKGFRHSPDFRSVYYKDTKYSFTTAQAACIKILYEQWENKTPEISAEYILTEIGYCSQRLSDLFKKHSAWGKLIISGNTKGSYLLNISDSLKIPCYTHPLSPAF